MRADEGARLPQALGGWEGLEEEVFRPHLEKDLRDAAVFRRPLSRRTGGSPRGREDRPDVGEDVSLLPGGLPRQGVARPQDLPHRPEVRFESGGVGGEGVGLEGARARLPVGAVDGQHVGGVGEVRELAAGVPAGVEAAVPGAHRAVEEEAVFLQIFPHRLHRVSSPNTSLAMSAERLASFA